jgi:hypothetical protein
MLIHAANTIEVKMQMALVLTGSMLDKATFFLIALEEAIGEEPATSTSALTWRCCTLAP